MRKETISFDGNTVKDAAVFANRYVRFLVCFVFPEGTLAEDAEARLHNLAFVMRFGDGSGYVTMVELLGKTSNEKVIEAELDVLGGKIDAALNLPKGTAKAHSKFSFGIDSDRWDEKLNSVEKEIIRDSSYAAAIEANANDNGFKCPICGAQLWYSAQSCRHDVIVDGLNDFVDDIGIGDADTPDGSLITCVRCGAEIGDNLPDPDEKVDVTDSNYLNIGTLDEPKLVAVSYIKQVLREQKIKNGELPETNFREAYAATQNMTEEEKAHFWVKAKFAGANIGNLRCGFGLK